MLSARQMRRVGSGLGAARLAMLARNREAGSLLSSVISAPPQRGMSLFGNISARLGRRAARSGTDMMRYVEDAANSNPSNPGAQLTYIEALMELGYGAEVVRRVESGRFAVDGDVLGVYARAQGATRNLSEPAVRELTSRLRRAHAASGGDYLSGDTIRAAAGGGGGGGMFGGPPGGGYMPNQQQQSQAASFFGRGNSNSGGADPYFGPSPTYDAASAGSGGYSGGGGGFPGGGPNAGTRTNPLVVEMARDARKDWITLALRIAGWGLVGYLVYTMVSGKGGIPGPLAQLTNSDITEEVTDVPTTRFGDVKGVDEAKHELEDIVAFLRDPEKFRRLGAKVPRGLLLTGPPGTGKTLLARAVAGEAGCKFYSKSAAEFEEMLVGLGARRVRDLFAAAKKNAPAIIFIDEIDALGGKRKVSLGGGSERQTLNQLLSSMDGFAKHENVIVIAATNTPEILDPALTRPGRFDSTVNVPLPDVRGRQEIIELYLSRVVASPKLDPILLARATPGFSGAQIEALINSAALMAAQRGADCIETPDIEEARDKIIMGPAKKSRVKRADQMRLTAYHEGGHTLAAIKTPGAHDLHKVTIMPRGFSGGATYSLPKDDELETKEAILAAIDVCMGGRAAEELVYGEDKVTTGAGMDMQQASSLARRFTMAYSMSSLGLSSFADGTKPSPEKRAAIDREVEKILQDSYVRVKGLLASNRPQLDQLAGALLEHETLDAEDVRAVIAGKALPSLRERLSEKAKAAERRAPPKASGGAPAVKAAGAGAAAGKAGEGGASGPGGGSGGGSTKQKPLWAQEAPHASGPGRRELQ